MINETSIIEIKKKHQLIIHTNHITIIYALFTRNDVLVIMQGRIQLLHKHEKQIFKKRAMLLKQSTHHGPANHIHNKLTYIHSFWLFSLTCWSVKSIVTIVIWCSDAMCSICFVFNNIIDRLFDFLDPRVSIVIIIVIITLDIIFILSSSLFMLVTSIIIVLLLQYQVPGVMDIISS